VAIAIFIATMTSLGDKILPISYIITYYFSGIGIYFGGKTDKTVKYTDIDDIGTSGLINGGNYFIFD